MSTYTFAQLEELWKQAGGAPAAAPMAAAVALAESSGRSDSVSAPNKNGSKDWGLWQINNGGEAMLDPAANARRAVQMSNNGANWRPWCVAYSDNACGTNGGTYQGPGANYQKYLGGNPAQNPALIGVSDGPAGTTSSATSVAADSDCILSVPKVGWGPFKVGGQCIVTHSQGRAILGAVSMGAGVIVMLAGTALVLAGTRAGKAVASIVPGPAGVAGKAAAGAGAGAGQARELAATREQRQFANAKVVGDANKAAAPRTSGGGLRVVGSGVSMDELAA